MVRCGVMFMVHEEIVGYAEAVESEAWRCKSWPGLPRSPWQG